MNRPETTFEFGEFRFTPEENFLVKGTEPIALPPKALAVLRVLIENAGRVVTKDELIEEVWGDTFVEESALAKNIWHIRQALGDDPKGHRFIQTVPKRGYRFVSRVNNRWFSGAFSAKSILPEHLLKAVDPPKPADPPDPLELSDPDLGTAGSVETVGRRRSLLWVVAAVLAIVALGLIVIPRLG